MGKRSRSGKKSKRDMLLGVCIIAFIAILCFTTLPLAQMIKMTHDYRKYVDTYTDSLTDARRRGGLMAEMEGRPWRLTNDQGSRLYTVLLDAGMGKPRKDAPSEEEMLVLSFPDGARMYLAETVITDKARERDLGLFVRFVSSDGRIWQYDTDRVDPEKLFGSLM